MKTVIMIAMVTLAGTVGDLLVSRGMKQIGEVHSFHWRALLPVVKKGAANLSLLGGILSMGVAFFSLLTVLSWAPLSLVEPATAVSYVLNTIGAKFFLNEKIDRTRWVGTVLVCAGAMLLSLSETSGH